MTKEEVLQGALALNGNDKNYIITIEGNRIILEAKYLSLAHSRTSTFRVIACLNEDNTYVELHEDKNRGRMQVGKVVKVKKSFSFTFGGDDGKVEIEKERFNSEECKKVVRDYLEGCGYKRTNRGFFKRLFGK